jgi:tetratricopeptide (TPR) repeat protein
MLRDLSHVSLRHLAAAEGYLELGMPEHALRELDEFEDAGQLEPARRFLIGQALMDLGDFEGATEHLHEAAESFPVLQSGHAWELLGLCYAECGIEEMAEAAALAAAAVGEIRDVLANHVGRFQQIRIQVGSFSVVAEIVVPSEEDETLDLDDGWSGPELN